MPARSPAARGDSRTGSSGQTVLVVDDDAAVRAVAKRILERAGYRVLSAVSAAEAESVWASHDGPIDLLMTDLMMPDTNGADLAKHFIAARPQSRVLYTSGYTGENVVRRGLIAGDASFLAKPFSIDDALAKVHQALTTGGRASI
ncbi:MAG TPA: response regulator [Gemmatimonadaceae bacterium]|nr:response regulator [Gemmatimonadaceae bacterium]